MLKNALAAKPILGNEDVLQKQNHNQPSKAMNLSIYPKKGLGDLHFDQPIEDIVQLLGDADEVESIDNAADETTIVLHYYDNGLTLFCEGENPMLSCIDINNDEATLFSKKVFDLTEKEIVRLMVDNQYFEQDADTEDWGERRISFPEGNIDFYFEDGELTSVIIGK